MGLKAAANTGSSLAPEEVEGKVGEYPVRQNLPSHRILDTAAEVGLHHTASEQAHRRAQVAFDAFDVLSRGRDCSTPYQ